MLSRRNTLIYYIALLLLATLSRTQIVNNSITTTSTSTNNSSQTFPIQKPVMFTIIDSVKDTSTPNKVLQQLAVPGFSWKHGYNVVALDGWTCAGDLGTPIKIWQNPVQYMNRTLGNDSSLSQTLIKGFYSAGGIKLLANAFSSFQNPASSNLSASDCAGKLLSFVKQNKLDGANIDFRDQAAMKGGIALSWLTQFMLSLNQNQNNLTISLSLPASFLNLTRYPTSNLLYLHMAVGKQINFYVINYYDSLSSFSTYQDIFTVGVLSIQKLVGRGFPITKLVVGKPSAFNQTGFVNANQMLLWFQKAYVSMSWWTGAAISPFVWQEARDLMKPLVLRRDTIEPIIATNLDSINFWWPPEKTVSDIGVPSFAPNNPYNYFIFGTWTCQNGQADIAKLWSAPSFYLSTNFGTSNSQIQTFLRDKYHSKGKKIVVRAFGNAQSPTTSLLDPITCAKGLAAYVLANNLDGTDIHYKDNIAFNNGFAQTWLVTFSNALRNMLPFHLISHSIEDYLLNSTNYRGGAYQSVIAQVGPTLDFYSIVYYGDQHTNFNTYQQLFTNSGAEIPQISVSELVAKGFQLNKIVIAKPVRLFDAQGAGFTDPATLRNIFLQASNELGWRAGICYSSYINDQNGASPLALLKGIDANSSIRFAYVNNVNIWWPPSATLQEMGVPSIAPPNIYNYFAYAFWTCKEPLAITKVYNDPIHFFGNNSIGKNKTEIQKYIKMRYENASVKLLISAFGSSQLPVNESYDAIECADKLILFVQNNLVDGIDVDFEDSESFINGTGQEWLWTFTRQIRISLPFHILSHAPQAPYFSPNFAPTGAYRAVHRQVGSLIDFYNIQFYNQGNTTYDTYHSLFIDSGILNPNSSLFQIIAQGIEPRKVVLGKPANISDAYNTGYVNATALNELLIQSQNDSSNPGWKPSVMFWHFLSDLNGSSIATAFNKL